MRAGYICLIVAGVALCTSVLADSSQLLGWWRMDEGEGATVLSDSSGNGRHAKVGRGVTIAEGKFGRAAHFDGTPDAWARFDINTKLTNFTLACWFNVPVTYTNNLYPKIFQFNSAYLQLMHKSPGRFNLGIGSEGEKRAEWSSVDEDVFKFETGRWHHAAVVVKREIEGEGGWKARPVFYLDGVRCSMDELPLKSYLPDNLGESGSVYLGNSSSGGKRAFEGLLDEVRVYDCALDDDQVWGLYKSNGVEEVAGEGRNPAMSRVYWKIWNPEIQGEIDRRIEKYRKADGVVLLPGVLPGKEVEIEQVGHSFIFGAQIFNFNQLGDPEQNKRYRETFGTLFNGATIAFYWRDVEPRHGYFRFKGEERDSEAFWNQCVNPKEQKHWRRPATDPVVEFCESMGIRMHGHPIIWNNRGSNVPNWIFEEFCPADEKKRLAKLGKDGVEKLAPAEIAALIPEYTRNMQRLYQERIRGLAEYYGGRVHSWDVVNESELDFANGVMVPGDKICYSRFGLMPGDYTWQAFQMAAEYFPASVKLNINDSLKSSDRVKGAIYPAQVSDLLGRGCRIDIMGVQMHLFRPEQSLDLAIGRRVGLPVNSPQQIWSRMEMLSEPGVPLHLSEITIAAPGSDEESQQIQAVIARNLYRVWFSVEGMMGITWWNVVDEGGGLGPTQPRTSGLFTRDMQPKAVYHALDGLINHEWKTRMTVKCINKGEVSFRGFKGHYQAKWQGRDGKVRRAEFELSDSGVLQ